jgi:leader peptidase (prepilin peptidase)/N-methyltransferase
VNALLVTGTTVAGLVIGGVVDPLGQRLADRSQLEAEQRRLQQASEASEASEAAVDETTHPVEPAAAVRNLVPSGRVPARTVSAALLTGALFGGAAAQFGADIILAPFCVFFALLVGVSMTDLTHRLVPRRLLFGALALIVPLLIVTSAVDHGWHNLTGAAVAGAVAFGFFFGTWWFFPKGMGYGDVRLAGAIGITVGYLSLLHAYVAFLAGFIIGALFGVLMMVGSSSGRKTKIPFAPSLAAGAVIAVFWGGPLAHSLFHAGS